MRTVLVSVLVALGVGGWLGYRVAIGACAARELTVANAYLSNQNAALDAAYRDAEAESARRTAQALRDERRAAAARAARLRGQADARANPRPECALPDARRVLFNAAIDAANAADAAPERMPAGVPPAAAP